MWRGVSNTTRRPIQSGKCSNESSRAGHVIVPWVKQPASIKGKGFERKAPSFRLQPLLNLSLSSSKPQTFILASITVSSPYPYSNIFIQGASLSGLRFPDNAQTGPPRGGRTRHRLFKDCTAPLYMSFSSIAALDIYMDMVHPRSFYLAFDIS